MYFIIFALQTAVTLRRAVHKTIKGITADYHRFSFNTIVAKLMELCNVMMKSSGGGNPAYAEAQRAMASLIAPLAPHIADELWERYHAGESPTLNHEEHVFGVQRIE